MGPALALEVQYPGGLSLLPSLFPPASVAVLQKEATSAFGMPAMISCWESLGYYSRYAYKLLLGLWGVVLAESEFRFHSRVYG